MKKIYLIFGFILITTAVAIVFIARQESSDSGVPQSTEKTASESVGYQTTPFSVKLVDRDGDKFPDNEEISTGTDPDNPDTDGDGLTDWEEVAHYRTDPLNPDTDGDGFLDGEEVLNGFNPLGEGRL